MKHKILGLVMFMLSVMGVLLFSAQVRAAETVYEDAEDGNTVGWSLWAPYSAVTGTVANVADDTTHGKVIEINITNPNYQEYKLLKADGTVWNDVNKILRWDMKTSKEMYLYASVETSVGQKYVMYSFNYRTGIISNYYSLRLPAEFMDGAWHSFSRNLEEDINTLQSGVIVTKINYFMAGGVGRFDNIKTADGVDSYIVSGKLTGENGAALSGVKVKISSVNYETTTDVNGFYKFDALVNGSYIITPQNNNYVFTPLNTAVQVAGANQTDINFASERPTVNVYEDGEDVDINGWSKWLPNSTIPASVINVYDNQKKSRVIELAVQNANYQEMILRNQDNTNWNNSWNKNLAWDMKTNGEMYVYAYANTSLGNKYFMYSFNYRTGVIGSYYSMRLDPKMMDNKWHSFERDLQADLNTFDPNAKVNYVYYLMVGGNGRFDNISLQRSAVVAPTGGQLQVSLASDSPSSSLFAAGATVTLAAYNFSATDEDVELDYINLTQLVTDSVFSSYKDYDQIWFEDANGMEIYGTRTTPTSNNPRIDFTDNAFVVRTTDGIKTLFLKAKLATISSETNGVSGHQVGYKINTTADVVAKGDLTEVTSTIKFSSTLPAGNISYVYKAYPVFSRRSVVSNKLTNSTVQLYRFQISAVNGDISLNGFTFSIASNATTVMANSLHLLDITDPSNEILINNTGGSVVAGLWQTVGYNNEWNVNYPANEIVVPANQFRTFAVYGNLAGVGPGSWISTGIAGDAAKITVTNTNMLSASDVGNQTHNDFIWSDRSDVLHSVNTLDWTNGYLVSGLNPDISTLETLAY